MKKRIALFVVGSLILSSIVAGCGTSTSTAPQSQKNTANKTTIKVAATSVPHAEMLDYIKGDLEQQGIFLDVIVVEDYNVPNRALAEKEVDANFFQHYPYMNAQINEFKYEIKDFARVHIEPMGFYSAKIKSLDELKDGAIIAVPNDPTNEARALALLHQKGLIELEDPTNLNATVLNIKSNPKNIKFQEVDAALLPRTLEDVEGAVINSNFAMQANLVPTKDALIIEDGVDNPFVNILVIRKGDEGRVDLKALAEVLTSDKMKAFIDEKYKGAVVPAF